MLRQKTKGILTADDEEQYPNYEEETNIMSTYKTEFDTGPD